MLHFTRTDHCPLEESRPATPTIAERIASGWHAFLYRRRVRATERMLLGLSDRTLKDIGIHRSEINSLARNGDTRMRMRRPLSSSRYY